MRTSSACKRAIAASASASALLALALVPASGEAALVPFGSDLSAPANFVEARQADTAYWQTTFPDGHSPVAPASGQIVSLRLKGIALANPVAGVPGGETMFHLQALRAQPDGSFLILRTSQAFFVPPKGTDPQTITSYVPDHFCIDAGDTLAFNTVGGWDGITDQTGPYPMGTPLQIFSRIPTGLVSQFMGAGKTNNGDYLTASPLAGHELLMQMTVGTGPDAASSCPGGSAGASQQPPPRVQKATLPPKQKVTVSKTGKLSISLFCLPGTAPCVGKVRLATAGSKPKAIGSAPFDIAPKTTGHATIHLTKTGLHRFKSSGKKLKVTFTATTNPGGPTRTATFATTLRKRGG